MAAREPYAVVHDDADACRTQCYEGHGARGCCGRRAQGQDDHCEVLGCEFSSIDGGMVD